MIEIDYGGTDKLILRAVEARVEQVGPHVMAMLDAKDAEMVSWIQGEELHGQVLNQISGKLAGSIRYLPARQEGTSIIGEVEGAGGPAWYGIIHEFGGTFHVESRRVAIGSKSARRSLSEEAMHGGYDFQTHAASHPYDIHFPARPFMSPALAQLKSGIVAGVETAISEALEGK